MEYHRKQAKALVRAFRAGDADAIRRAEAVLADRAHDRFALSDAQHVVAREHGYRTWLAFRAASKPVRGEIRTTNRTYGPYGPVEILVRKRGWRYDISDCGRAVELSGRRAGWHELAAQVVDAYALNVNRRGVVFVQANESRVRRLVERVADCSVALYEELLDRSQPDCPGHSPERIRRPTGDGEWVNAARPEQGVARGSARAGARPP